MRRACMFFFWYFRLYLSVFLFLFFCLRFSFLHFALSLFQQGRGVVLPSRLKCTYQWFVLGLGAGAGGWVYSGRIDWEDLHLRGDFDIYAMLLSREFDQAAILKDRVELEIRAIRHLGSHLTKFVCWNLHTMSLVPGCGSQTYIGYPRAEKLTLKTWKCKISLSSQPSPPFMGKKVQDYGHISKLRITMQTNHH